MIEELGQKQHMSWLVGWLEEQSILATLVVIKKITYKVDAKGSRHMVKQEAC